MTKKDLIQLIKEKADEVQIKDHSDLILERIKNLPQQKEIIQEPIKKWRLKPILLGSLSLVTTLIMALLFASTFQPHPIEPIDISLESYEEAIVLSSVSTASLSNLIETELSINMYTMMHTLDEPMVSNEIDALSKYLGMMEKLLSTHTSNEAFTIESNVDGTYQKRITFKTNDLLDNELSYVMDLNTSMMNDSHFLVEGILIIEEETYQIKMIGKKDDDSRLVYRLSKDDQNYVEVTAEIELDEMTAQIEIVKDGQRNERIRMIKSTEGTKAFISIQFVNEAERGVYQFEKDIENEHPVMRVNYVIESDEIERGMMIIRVMNQNEQYEMEISPQGKPPFVVNPGRRTTPNRGLNQ